jgi:hypothetical protein
MRQHRTRCAGCHWRMGGIAAGERHNRRNEGGGSHARWQFATTELDYYPLVIYKSLRSRYMYKPRWACVTLMRLTHSSRRGCPIMHCYQCWCTGFMHPDAPYIERLLTFLPLDLAGIGWFFYVSAFSSEPDMIDIQESKAKTMDMFKSISIQCQSCPLNLPGIQCYLWDYLGNFLCNCIK